MAGGRQQHLPVSTPDDIGPEIDRNLRNCSPAAMRNLFYTCERQNILKIRLQNGRNDGNREMFLGEQNAKPETRSQALISKSQAG